MLQPPKIGHPEHKAKIRTSGAGMVLPHHFDHVKKQYIFPRRTGILYIHRVVFEMALPVSKADFLIAFWPKADLPQLPSSCQSLVWRSHPISSKYINK